MKTPAPVTDLAVFETRHIRRVYDEKAETWYFSVVDIVAALTEQTDFQKARKYWNKLKERLAQEGSQLVTNCHRLKLRAEDGKQRLTDVANAETLLRLVQSVPSPKAEPIKLWLAKVGYERIKEMADPEIALIPIDWKLCTVDCIINKHKKSLISGPFGSNISSKYFVEVGIPVIRGNNLSLDLTQKFVDENFAYITQQKADELGAWAVKDDLVFTAVGTIGQVGLLTGKEKYEKYIISNKQLRLTVNKDVVTPLFAYYWFASDQMQDHIIQRNTGSSVPLINLGILKSLPIPIPSIEEQQAIAAVLSSLDDKIDLLHRQNKTLETLAQTLFRQWFVEEADENIGVLGDIIKLSYGKALKEEVRSGTGFPVFGSNGIVGYHSEPFVKGPGIVIGRKGTLGNVFYVTEDFYPIDTTYYIVPKRKPVSLYYEYFLLKSLSFENSDSAVPGLNRDIALSHEIAIQRKDKIESFDAFCRHIFNKMKAIDFQIRTLTKLRDTLLPKLMSGEMRVEA